MRRIATVPPMTPYTVTSASFEVVHGTAKSTQLKTNMESKTKKARNEEKEDDLNETPIHVGPIRPTQAKKEEFRQPTPKLIPRGSLSQAQGVWREEADN